MQPPKPAAEIVNNASDALEQLAKDALALNHEALAVYLWRQSCAVHWSAPMCDWTPASGGIEEEWLRSLKERIHGAARPGPVTSLQMVVTP